MSIHRNCSLYCMCECNAINDTVVGALCLIAVSFIELLLYCVCGRGVVHEIVVDIVCKRSIIHSIVVGTVCVSAVSFVGLLRTTLILCAQCHST